MLIALSMIKPFGFLGGTLRETVVDIRFDLRFFILFGSRSKIISRVIQIQYGLSKWNPIDGSYK